jgi:hypothetical protein
VLLSPEVFTVVISQIVVFWLVTPLLSSKEERVRRLPRLAYVLCELKNIGIVFG